MEIKRSCRFVKGNIELLAGLIGVTYPELVDIQQNYRTKDICALRLIEKWMQRNPEKSKDDLHQLLLDANQHEAAKRLIAQLSDILIISYSSLFVQVLNSYPYNTVVYICIYDTHKFRGVARGDSRGFWKPPLKH